MEQCKQVINHKLNESIGGVYDEDHDCFVFGDIPLRFYIIDNHLCRINIETDKDDGVSVNLNEDPTVEQYAEAILYAMITYEDINVEQLRSLVNSHPPIKEIVDRVSPARYTITDPHVRRVFCALTVNGT